jgi:hypothetical protein
MSIIKILKAVLLIVIITDASSTLMAATIVVDANGLGDFTKIQEAIDASSDFDTIIVHPGFYEEHIDYHGRIITIMSLDPNDLDIVNATIVDGNDTGNVVAFRNAENESSVLCGLTIQNGDIGVYCNGKSVNPSISRCAVHLNRWGFWCTDNAKIRISDTTISHNTEGGTTDCFGDIVSSKIMSNGTEGIYGHKGNIVNCIIYGNGGDGVNDEKHLRYHVMDTNFVDCVISGNVGYGVRTHGKVKLSNCTVSNNGEGGVICFGIGDNWPTLTMYNCIISGNKGRYGIRWGRKSLGDVQNCTIVGNRGSGIGLDELCTGIIANNIFVQNTNTAIRGDFLNNAGVEIQYNNFFENPGGAYDSIPSSGYETPSGKYDTFERPLFALNGYWDTDGNWIDGDYHLMSTWPEGGRWNPVLESWVTDDVDSPCLNRGDPNSPIGVEPNPNGGRINLGAYGGTAEASKSNGIEPICTEYPEMDFNKDCKVDQTDLELFMEHWLECNLDPQDACWPDGIPEDSF